MRVKLDRDNCIGCELCTEIYPEVFRMADDGLAEVYDDPTEENYDLVEEAAESCPASVILIDYLA